MLPMQAATCSCMTLQWSMQVVAFDGGDHPVVRVASAPSAPCLVNSCNTDAQADRQIDSVDYYLHLDAARMRYPA